MRINPYIASLAATSCFAWGAWAVVLTKLSPFGTGLLTPVAFYASLFIGVTSLSALLFYAPRAEKSGRIYASLRQGILVALLIVASLIFQRLRVLTWWNGVMLLLLVSFVEYYFSGGGE